VDDDDVIVVVLGVEVLLLFLWRDWAHAKNNILYDSSLGNGNGFVGVVEVVVVVVVLGW
jgi:hypothetical protein